MQEKQTAPELAQKALELLNETDKLEEEQNWAKAIEKYQQAAEYLKQSGFLPHRIEDIYNRITEIKTFLDQKSQYQKQTQQIHFEQIQEQAFAILDAAKKLETDGYFEDAIQQYMSAIRLLVNAGWTESQLENLKAKILSLTQNIEQQKLIQQQRETIYFQQQTQIPVDSKPQRISVDIEKPIVDQKSEKIKAFEAKRKKVEEIQKESFQLIDQAKIFEKEKKYENAISNYQEAIRLLNSIGWTDQTKNLQILIGKLKKDKENFERIEVQKKESLYFDDIEVKLAPDQAEAQAKVEIKKQKLIEFESKKKKEEEIQTKAFNLIDIGKRLEREKKYDEAIKNFQNSIELLQSISWDSYIQPIANFINEINEKREREVKAEQLKKKRQDDLNKLQETIHKKQKQTIVQSAQEFESRKRDFEQEKLQQAKREEEFFYVLENADKVLQEEKDYEKAIYEYERALKMLESLGAGWESYVSTIQATISNIKQRREFQSEKELEILKKKDEQIEKELEFQKHIDELLKKERKKLQQKEIELRDHEEEVRYREEAKNKAFQYLETAQNYIKEGEFDKAIYAYQNAGNIFAEIQWTDELPLIEKSISELEMRKKDLFFSKQEEIQKLIQREKQEREFQTQLSTQLQLEREKLKQKEIALREHEREIEYRETRKNEAFKLLEEAQNQLKKGEFDKAIEIYHRIANIFAEIQWKNEIDLIQNAITEIENRKREALIQKQVEIQKTLEKERDERVFQENMSRAIQNYIKNLKEKEVIIKDQAEELNYRENKKEDAFELLDKANSLLSLRKFDEAIEIYYNVANIFAQIHWTDEILIIQNAIKEVKEKQLEIDLWKQKTIEKGIEKETAYQTFIDQMKTQREIEKSKLLEKSEIIKKQKALSAQNLAKQEYAFKIIDEGDEFLKQEKFDEAITKFKTAESILKEIGWEASYLRILKDNLRTIEIRKSEKEKEIKREKEIREKRQLEEQQFQLRITEEFRKEKEKMEAKQIELQKREVLKAKMEEQKLKAFGLINEAEKLLHAGKYDQSLEIYRQVDLIFNEIQFPAQAIKEAILKVQEKKKEEILTKQKELERQLKKNQEELLFAQQISEKMEIEKQKMQSKQIEVKKKEELKEYMELRKKDAFKLLEDAEIFMNQSLYDKALEFYQSAQLILNEIQYPIDIIRDMVSKVQEKKKNYELRRQKEIENKIQKEREVYEFQKKLTEDFRKERERLSVKKLELEKKENLKAKLEEKREQAFKILDEAQNFTKQLDFDHAIEYYRKAELILNEIHFSTETIRGMIAQVINLKKEKEKQKELELTRELEQIEEEKQLKLLIEERKRQEGEKRAAQQMAIQKREKIIQEQIDQREAAYALLEEAAKYLKSRIPDYDKAISLYVQAKKILAEKVGWEPEIVHLEGLIKDLQQEKSNFLEKQRIEAQTQLKRQHEYELFKEEMRRKRLDHEKQMEDQRSKLKQFEERKELETTLRDEGLRLIGEGKKNAELKAFNKAYQLFERAISHFREIGWNEQIQYIETEIKNTKILEENYKREEFEREKLKDELERKRQLEMERWKQEDLKMKATIGDVGSLTDEVSSLFRAREEKLKLTKEQRKQQIKNEAKEFSRSMGRMLHIKQELLVELKNAEEEKKKKEEEKQKAKEREKVDEIARMIKEVSKKDK